MNRASFRHPGLLAGALATALLLLAALPDAAQAAGFFVCSDGNTFTRTTNPTQAARWFTNTITINRNTTSFPPANDFTLSLGASRLRWNNGPHNININESTTNRANVAPGDGFSDAAFTTSTAICGGGANACAPLVYNCTTGITEADLVFQVTPPFTNRESKAILRPYGGTFLDFKVTAVHELGHVLGLAHTANVVNVMGDAERHTHANGLFAQTYPGEDAVTGAIALYGTDPSSAQDVAVTHWRHCGQSGAVPGGAISTHCFIRMFDSAGSLRPSTARTATSGERVYQVRRGQAIRLELIYENNGRSTQSGVTVGFYLSADDNIQRAEDQRFGQTSITLSRDVPVATTTPLTLPTRDASGALLVNNRIYFLGAIVDDSLRISEFDESNATYVPIQIVP